MDFLVGQQRIYGCIFGRVVADHVRFFALVAGAHGPIWPIVRWTRKCPFHPKLVSWALSHWKISWRVYYRYVTCATASCSFHCCGNEPPSKRMVCVTHRRKYTTNRIFAIAIGLLPPSRGGRPRNCKTFIDARKSNDSPRFPQLPAGWRTRERHCWHRLPKETHAAVTREEGTATAAILFKATSWLVAFRRVLSTSEIL